MNRLARQVAAVRAKAAALAKQNGRRLGSPARTQPVRSAAARRVEPSGSARSGRALAVQRLHRRPAPAPAPAPPPPTHGSTGASGTG